MKKKKWKLFKTLLSIYGVCVFGMSVCLVIILTSKKQVKELKHDFKQSMLTIDSLTATIDTAAIWFHKNRVFRYESIDTLIADYDHGRELNIYFKYTD